MSNIVKGENFGSLTDSMNNILESRDSDSIQLSEDDFEEVNDLQFSYNNLFEKFSDLLKMNKRASKKIKDIDSEKDRLLDELKNSFDICDTLHAEDIMVVAKVKSLVKE